MTSQAAIFISTVCLDRNRWGSREPSLLVSEWLPRFQADGFDGIELWEYHYLRADSAEQAALDAAAESVAIYNTYAGFSDSDEDGAARAAAATAIERLTARAVKYNLGGDQAQLKDYRRNLLDWAQRLPSDCRLLCECHPGSVLETLPAAAAFFEDLDPGRFGVIAHVSGNAKTLDAWLSAMGERIQHLHLQLRSPDLDPAIPENRERLDPCFAAVHAHGFSRSASIEFTRGIGRDEQPERIYAHALTDRAYCQEKLGPRKGDSTGAMTQ